MNDDITTQTQKNINSEKKKKKKKQYVGGRHTHITWNTYIYHTDGSSLISQ